MNRPQSIVLFERCYLGALAVGVINNMLNWSSIQGRVAAVPNATMFPSWFLPATVVVSLLVSLMLWYLIARRASVAAKWIVTVFLVLGLLGLPAVIGGMSSGLVTPIMAGAALISFVLNAVAVWALFRPDAKRWFDGAPDLQDTFS